MVYEYQFELAQNDETYNITLEEEIYNFSMAETIQLVHGESYDGDYTVTPKMFEGTVLPTKDKTMTDDVTVLEVPFYEVSNASGGTTVYIATEGYNE